MSTFSVPVVRVRDIESIDGADAIELAVIGDYRSIVRKGQYRVGDLAVYLPEGSILPEEIIQYLGLSGRLAGAEKNRVKAMKLRGCLSQGILYDGMPNIPSEGSDVSEDLGITKWEPAVPLHMSGEVTNLANIMDSRWAPVKYDIENYKRYPDVIREGEPVEITEKTHGTFCGVGIIPGMNAGDMFSGDGIVYSKGLGAKGLVFKDNVANASNVYVQCAKNLELHAKIKRAFPCASAHVLGEVYGYGVQDLAYGKKGREFAAFDIVVNGSFLSRHEFEKSVAALGIERVPVLYSGPFSRDILYKMTDGKTVIGTGSHMREGVVVVPHEERQDKSIGRVILKSVSGDYLTRKGNVTEFN